MQFAMFLSAFSLSKNTSGDSEDQEIENKKVNRQSKSHYINYETYSHVQNQNILKIGLLSDLN